jgi:clathrin heavy chain
MGLFTALADALAKYHPERVMEHLRLFWSRINIPKAIQSVEAAHLWVCSKFPDQLTHMLIFP